MFDSEFERGLFDLRKSKLEEIEKLGQAAYPNQFPATHTVPAVRERWVNAAAEDLEANRVTVAVAGRIMAIRAQGKAGFATLQQGGERLQTMSAWTRWASRDLRCTSCSTWGITLA